MSSKKKMGRCTMASFQTRRRFIGSISLAGAAHFICAPAVLAAEPRPEITTLRLASLPPGVCIAPQYAAEELLRAEGFREIEYVPSVPGAQLMAAITARSIDFTMNYAGTNIIAVAPL